jgi:sigma-E factor negative regulatory protein RseA
MFMSESKFETVSSLVDNYQTGDKAFDEIVNDADMSETWERYHLIGDVLRDDTCEQINIDLSANIAAAIADEPTVLAPKQTSITETVKAKVVQFARPFGQMAIAASAAGLMVIGVQQNVAQNDSIVVPNQVVQTTPLGGIAEPVSLNYKSQTRNAKEQALVEQQRRFKALLQDHRQQVKLTALVNEPKKTTEKAQDTPK